MAKKKASKTKAKPVQERRAVAVTIKGNEAWRDWLEEASDHCRVTISAFLDSAAAEYAKMRGFTKEPPKR